MKKILITAAAGIITLGFAVAANAQTGGAPTGTGGASNQSSTTGTMDKQQPAGAMKKDKKMESGAMMDSKKSGNDATGMGQGKANQNSK